MSFSLQPLVLFLCYACFSFDFTAVLTNDGVCKERDLFPPNSFKPLSRNLRFLQALNAFGEQLELRLEVDSINAAAPCMVRRSDSWIAPMVLLGFLELDIDQWCAAQIPLIAPKSMACHSLWIPLIAPHASSPRCLPVETISCMAVVNQIPRDLEPTVNRAHARIAEAYESQLRNCL